MFIIRCSEQNTTLSIIIANILVCHSIWRWFSHLLVGGARTGFASACLCGCISMGYPCNPHWLPGTPPPLATTEFSAVAFIHLFLNSVWRRGGRLPAILGRLEARCTLVTISIGVPLLAIVVLARTLTTRLVVVVA